MTPTSSMQVSIVESIIFQSFNVKPEKILIFLKIAKIIKLPEWFRETWKIL